ncbi:MAG: protein kinase [Acidobacteria bacterium]|nr:protein kinase [Acidobacteriota bacterium]
MSSTPNIDALIGKDFAGRFRLIEKIGQGGMGAVFKAVHTQMGRTCAIKLLLPMTSDTDSMIARFKREAQMASRIDNPHAVTIYDFGEAEGGMLYLAMEFIEGRHLGQLLAKERPLATDRIVHITAQIAAALSAAHSLGIVHRDLKPENIMITRKGEDADYVKVLDFGIAKPVEDDDKDNLTKTGFVLGTPFYMSPEQLSGERLDARSDVYSLALLVYEMFSGKLPFEGDNSQAIMVKRLLAEPKPLREYVPAMSREVEQAVMNGLERHRDHRTASVEQFAAQLKQAIVATQNLSHRSTNSISEDGGNRATVSIGEQPTSFEKSTEFIGSIKDAPPSSQPPHGAGFAHTIGIEQAQRSGAQVEQPVSQTPQEAVVNPASQTLVEEPQRPPSAYITREVTGAPNPKSTSQPEAEATRPFGSEKAERQFPAPSPQPAVPQPWQPSTPAPPPMSAPFSEPQKTVQTFAHQPPQQNPYQAVTPPFQTQPSYPTPALPAPKSGSKALVISAVVVILLLALLGGSYFVYTNYISPQNVTPLTTSTNNPPTTKDNPLTIPNVPPTKTNLEAANIHYENGKKHQVQAASLNAKADATEENKKAIEEYRQAIALQPVFPQAHENLGAALYSIGNIEAALTEFKTAIDQYTQQQKNPTAQVFTNLGLALYELKRYKEAANAFQRAYEIDSTDADLLAHRGFALQNAGDVEGAKILYNKYLQAAPKGNYAAGIKEILAGRAKPPATTGN